MPRITAQCRPIIPATTTYARVHNVRGLYDLLKREGMYESLRSAELAVAGHPLECLFNFMGWEGKDYPAKGFKLTEEQNQVIGSLDQRFQVFGFSVRSKEDQHFIREYNHHSPAGGHIRLGAWPSELEAGEWLQNLVEAPEPAKIIQSEGETPYCPQSKTPTYDFNIVMHNAPQVGFLRDLVDGDNAEIMQQGFTGTQVLGGYLSDLRDILESGDLKNYAPLIFRMKASHYNPFYHNIVAVLLEQVKGLEQNAKFRESVLAAKDAEAASAGRLTELIKGPDISVADYCAREFDLLNYTLPTLKALRAYYRSLEKAYGS